MIDLSKEIPIPLSRACKLRIFSGSQRPHPATLYRWTTNGLRSVQLESVDIGGRRCTSEAALQRFFQRLTEIRAAESCALDPSPTASDRATRSRRADAILQNERW